MRVYVLSLREKRLNGSFDDLLWSVHSSHDLAIAQILKERDYNLSHPNHKFGKYPTSDFFCWVISPEDIDEYCFTCSEYYNVDGKPLSEEDITKLLQPTLREEWT